MPASVSNDGLRRAVTSARAPSGRSHAIEPGANAHEYSAIVYWMRWARPNDPRRHESRSRVAVTLPNHLCATIVRSLAARVVFIPEKGPVPFARRRFSSRPHRDHRAQLIASEFKTFSSPLMRDVQHGPGRIVTGIAVNARTGVVKIKAEAAITRSSARFTASPTEESSGCRQRPPAVQTDCGEAGLASRRPSYRSGEFQPESQIVASITTSLTNFISR